MIGGGNVALDAARTALREIAAAAEPDGRREACVDATLDVARVAKRMGARRVRVVALESREEMPAHEFEIEEAEVEGIEILTRRGPNRSSGDGHVEGLETLEVSSVFDPDGRFNPRFVEGTESVIECDSVILAIGQAPGSLVAGARGRRRGQPARPDRDRPRVARDERGGHLRGRRRRVRSAQPDRRDRRRPPRGGLDPPPDRRGGAARRRRSSGRKLLPIIEVRGRTRDYTEYPRVEIPAEPTERRIGSPEIELGYTEEQARTRRRAASSAS